MVKARNPELTSAIITGTKKNFTAEDEKSLSEAAQAVHQSDDPNAKGKLKIFADTIERAFFD